MILVPINQRIHGADAALDEVKKSHLEVVGYDAETQTLRVGFQGGAVYDYTGVPVEKAAAIVFAKSPGTVLNEQIKKAGYPYTKLEA